MFFDPLLLITILPAVALAFFAQWLVKSNFEKMSRVGARMSGSQAARRILDSQGLQRIPIELVHGHLSDHYDPKSKVVRLSEGVYGSNSMAAVGIAAHEVGHAIQDAKSYAPLVLRNLAVPVASIGGSIGSNLLYLGLAMVFSGGGAVLGKWVFFLGLVFFGATVAFQLINLPVEFDASSRAKTLLIENGIISGPELPNVSKVLNAAALTYVAATLQTLLTLIYYIFQFMAATRSER